MSQSIACRGKVPAQPSPASALSWEGDCEGKHFLNPVSVLLSKSAHFRARRVLGTKLVITHRVLPTWSFLTVSWDLGISPKSSTSALSSEVPEEADKHPEG